MVATSWSLELLITVMLSESISATKISPFEGSATTASGDPLTLIVAITRCWNPL